MTNKIDLLPCPFCGSKATLTIYSGSPAIFCKSDNCVGAMGGEEYSGTEAELASYWNRRAPAVERQDVLPCDVRVAPATTIRKGCKVETLMQCIQLRKGEPDKFTRFSDSPTAPVAVVLPDVSVIRQYHHDASIRLDRYADDADMRKSDSEHYRKRAAFHREQVACLDKVKELNQ